MQDIFKRDQSESVHFVFICPSFELMGKQFLKAKQLSSVTIFSFYFFLLNKLTIIYGITHSFLFVFYIELSNSNSLLPLLKVQTDKSIERSTQQQQKSHTK